VLTEEHEAVLRRAGKVVKTEVYYDDEAYEKLMRKALSKF